ncbi:MAG: hypothetical protein EXS59_01515 [Candidatus Taylorbacteria bacterium]|nr:hypothetical protein [Candidatus Taylorbacteria bacterium]
MFEYLEQLRNKPQSYRKRVAVVASSVFTGLIILIWISTFGVETAKVVDSKETAKEFAPFLEIKESTALFFSSLKQMAVSSFGVSATTTESVESKK